MWGLNQQHWNWKVEPRKGLLVVQIQKKPKTHWATGRVSDERLVYGSRFCISFKSCQKDGAK